MRIAIVGRGFVGTAVGYGFTHPKNRLYFVDPKLGTTINDLQKWQPDVAFVCVPTPSNGDGSIDVTILRNVMDKLMQTNVNLIVIKSTVTPDAFQGYRVDRVVYNPEFLVEGSSKQDFVDPKLHVFGGTEWATDMLARLYLKNSICTWCPIFAMTMDEAALVKYAINSFLALKVIFFNELYDTARHIDANFGVISDAIGSDPRIGHSHTKVPGFDGKRGFGGSCFPKDTQAFISYSRAQQLLRKCVEINSEYHRKYDDISGSLEPELDD